MNKYRVYVAFKTHIEIEVEGEDVSEAYLKAVDEAGEMLSAKCGVADPFIANLSRDEDADDIWRSWI